MENNVLIKGISVSPGTVSGKARVISNMEELKKVDFGEILILPNSHPMYAVAVMKAAAVICENGGKLSHICIVAMEMGIPCITQAKGAASTISTGQSISIDAGEGVIYSDE